RLTPWPADTVANATNHYNNYHRHNYTTLSGAAIFAPRLPNEINDPDLRLKLDINHASRGALALDIARVFASGNSPSLPTGLAGLDAESFADLMAACIVDYRDDDNVLTGVDTASDTMFYGF